MVEVFYFVLLGEGRGGGDWRRGGLVCPPEFGGRTHGSARTSGMIEG